MHQKALFKITLWLCGGLLLSGITACQQQPATEQFTIGFSQCTTGDNWRKAMEAEMRRELAFYPDMELVIRDANNQSDQQIQDIQELVQMGVDLLIVSPNEAKPITPYIEEVFQSGIPVIIVDRRTESRMYTAYVGADNYEIGKSAGEYIGKLLKGQGRILEIWGLPGSSPAINRHEGFLAGLSQYPDLQIVDSIDGNWEKPNVRRLLPQVLADHPPGDIDLVFSHNDRMALGGYQVFAEQNREDEVRWIGVDGLPGPNGGIQLVSDDILTATLLYPTGGEEAIRIASSILHQRPYQKENLLQTTIIDSTNVRVMKLQYDKILSLQTDIERREEKLTAQLALYQSQRNLLYVLGLSLLLALAMGGYAFFSLRQKQLFNRKLQLKNSEIVEQRNQVVRMAEEARLANQAKLKFFTNISHEFRTPLTLILGPVEDLLQAAAIQGNPGLKQNLHLIRQNAIRLLRLVNQLMDFRKIEHNKLKMKATEQDLIPFVRGIMHAFERVAGKRQMDFRLLTEARTVSLWFDANMMDKVLFNLLSNAFKFTEDKGRIHVSIKVDEPRQEVILQVADNGRGMVAEQAQQAFDRYYQGQEQGPMGTGLGLALSRELIELHHGQISVTSKKGQGTTFTLLLPMGKLHLAPEEISTESPPTPSYEDFSLYVEDVQPEGEVAESAAPATHTTLLLIEDQPDLRGFLRQQMGKKYQILEANNGQAGINLAFEAVPDLIICDVNLPEKDGLEVASLLKNDLRTSHIPIILLTARSSVDQQVAGMQTGADAYIVKPFNLTYLMGQVQTLLRNREILKERYLSDLRDSTQRKAAKEANGEKKFINQFIAVIEAGIGNPDLNSQEICTALGMSRVQLYRKVKNLLGYSVGDYIKQVRLKKAQYLLLNTDQPISEIAYEVGFSSPTYFSTVFKSHFQVSPSDFKSQHYAGKA